ncbi:5-bromo-4-chloroindolyl phosphate hydrolysis family protein [Zavarzinia compransoris]|uniref:5-bromo-4-chloroindolyl phosphate hydrolase n=1 Tax=Zavarzinia compransoris TaxID=1264899 RepID=A0A317E6Q4_9PROT|nr:5-bromo-4-chloroindolyl phosphate hydrolysis family protein [Zavarzinia compransoris]PWR22301.1 5-bromo-4-chloroindolyl phosphate hydrolase [Zavarzinia compransoris]TDP46935.1 5-bromo-4-chloroindolyl phosphate hydrolysis protein [Zavarzinia compransoris]
MSGDRGRRPASAPGGSGNNWLAGGLAGAAAVPALALGLDIPFLVAAGSGVLVCLGLAFALGPRRLFEGADTKSLSDEGLAFARELLAAALPEVRRLETEAARIKDPAGGKAALHLAALAREVTDIVEREPVRLRNARRLLTHFLPSAADLCAGVVLLEGQRSPDRERMRKATEMLARLERAFALSRDALFESDLTELDVDLQMLDLSLKNDLETRA